MSIVSDCLRLLFRGLGITILIPGALAVGAGIILIIVTEPASNE